MMAAFRIHEDQENRITTLSLQNQPLQQGKRAVLGVLHNNCQRNVKLDLCKDEKHTRAKPFVPTQFEPFKIYEDKKEEQPVFKIYEDKLEEETSVAFRDTKENQEIVAKIEVKTKTEREKSSSEINMIVESLPSYYKTFESQSERHKIEEITISQVCPMSIERASPHLNLENDARTKKDYAKELRNNFFYVDEYRADIHNYLRFSETRHRPKPGYMKKQPDITYLMRSILVDWLVEVAEEYRLQTETLYLAVSCIDRFLSYMSVVRAKLQLVGTAAMFIAAKYEEIYPPDVGEFVYITDDTYSKKQVLRMEHLILRVLSFDLTVPTPLAFLKDYCISNNLSDKIQYLAMYLCELSMLEGDPYLQYLPSHLAASAIALARHTLEEEVWPHELELSTGYSLQNLKECVTRLNKTFSNALKIQQQAIQEKYKSSKYGHVSLLLPRSSDIFTCEDEDENVQMSSDLVGRTMCEGQKDT